MEESLDYNTLRDKLLMPEYGRHVQKMIKFVTELPDKAKRNEQIQAVVSVMGTINPQLRDLGDFKHKLWDHLAVMSDYKLDIDYPYEITPKSNFTQKPTPLPYPMKKIHYRHYGYLLETLLKKQSLIFHKRKQFLLLLDMSSKLLITI